MSSDWEETCEMMGWGINDDIDWDGSDGKEEYGTDDPYRMCWSTLEEVKKVSMKYPDLRFVRRRFESGLDYFIVKEK